MWAGIGYTHFVVKIDLSSIAKQRLTGSCYDAAHLLWDGLTEQSKIPSIEIMAEAINILTGNQEACRVLLGKVIQQDISVSSVVEISKPSISIFRLDQGNVEVGSNVSNYYIAPPLDKSAGCYVWQNNGSLIEGYSEGDPSVFTFDELFLTIDHNKKIRVENGSESLSQRVLSGDYRDVIRMYWQQNELHNLSLSLGDIDEQEANYILGLSNDPSFNNPEVAGIKRFSEKYQNMAMDLLIYRIQYRKGIRRHYGAIGRDEFDNGYYIDFDSAFLFNGDAFSDLRAFLENHGINRFAMMDPVGYAETGDKSCLKNSFYVQPNNN